MKKNVRTLQKSIHYRNRKILEEGGPCIPDKVFQTNVIAINFNTDDFFPIEMANSSPVVLSDPVQHLMIIDMSETAPITILQLEVDNPMEE